LLEDILEAVALLRNLPRTNHVEHLTALLEEIARSGQASELNDVKCIGFVMNVASHPLQDPSLWISVVPSDVKCGIELKQQLFIPMLFVSNERQQSNFLEAI